MLVSTLRRSNKTILRSQRLNFIVNRTPIFKLATHNILNNLFSTNTDIESSQKNKAHTKSRDSIFDFLLTNEYCLSQHENDGMNFELYQTVINALKFKLQNNPNETLKELIEKIKIHENINNTNNSDLSNKPSIDSISKDEDEILFDKLHNLLSDKPNHEILKCQIPSNQKELEFLSELSYDTLESNLLTKSILLELEELNKSLTLSLNNDVKQQQTMDIGNINYHDYISHVVPTANTTTTTNDINDDEICIDSVGSINELKKDTIQIQKDYQMTLEKLKINISKIEQIQSKLNIKIKNKTEQENEIAKAMYPIIAAHANSEEYSAERARFLALRECSSMIKPHDWYPGARLFKRKIIYHGGPTNSGKTYHALRALREANADQGGGVFCGPLRLLALEVFEELNSEGVYCSLMTGQERKDVPFSNVTSCTIEMVNVNKVYDIGVIDEIQLIGDPHRGFAWTRAFLGLQAREVHVCGSLEAENLVRRLCEETGDDFELRTYDRMSPLKLLEEPLEDYANVEPGDCIVAFSRADIFRIREAIERKTAHKCCVIFGQLPPETRSKQAHLFNDVDSGYDVLVASDAVGMGLNLNIRRIIFHTTSKSAGKGKKIKLEPSMMKQIAGRAGRRSSQYKDQGMATCLKQEDLSTMHHGINAPVQQVEKAGLFPAVEHLQSFSDLLEELNETNTNVEEVVGSTLKNKDKKEDNELEFESPRRISVANVLTEFMNSCRIPPSGDYFICEHEEIKKLSSRLHPVIGQLPLKTAYPFCQAPINTNNPLVMTFLKKFAESWAIDHPTGLNVRLPNFAPKDVLQLSDLCTRHNIIDLYLWLSNRFPFNFVEKEVAVKHKGIAIDHIQQGLKTMDIDLEDIKKMSFNPRIPIPLNYAAMRKQKQSISASNNNNNNGVGNSRYGGSSRKDKSNSKRGPKGTNDSHIKSSTKHKNTTNINMSSGNGSFRNRKTANTTSNSNDLLLNVKKLKVHKK